MPLAEIIKKTKLRLLEMHYEAKAGHLGGNFSCIDALMTVHHCAMQADDRFVLSKGHSAGALYATLWSLGRLSDADLKTFSKDDSLLPGHPSGSGIPGLMFATGSLGHGPSLASGLALAARFQKSARHVYCLCSDGEWQEGSCWEAITFAVHQKLNNLTLLIDQNGLQGFGTTQEVISNADLTTRMQAFGAEVYHVNGHSTNEINLALKAAHNEKPKVIILNTIKGHGLHFENTVASHYLPLTESEYQQAREHLLMEPM
jgi:transketolase